MAFPESRKAQNAQASLGQYQTRELCTRRNGVSPTTVTACAYLSDKGLAEDMKE
jgi:hypothetical protein